LKKARASKQVLERKNAGQEQPYLCVLFVCLHIIELEGDVWWWTCCECCVHFLCKLVI